MHIVIRADASTQIGHGHVMRCLTLAHSLRARGASVSFVAREHPGDLCAVIEARGFAVHRLPPSVDAVQPSVDAAAAGYASWLGAPWAEDADETLKVLGKLATRPAWLIVDQYGVPEDWERRLAPAVDNIMVIEDLEHRPHACGVLLDQNLGAEDKPSWSDRVPAHCVRLLGERFALLPPEFSDARTRVEARTGSVRRILIFFGAADARNLTGRSLAAFLSLGRDDLSVDVVVPTAHPHLHSIVERVRSCRQAVLHQSLQSLAPLVAAADLAIGAAGTAALERISLGLPSLLVTLADNQRPGARVMHERSLAWWLGDDAEVTDDALVQALAGAVSRGADTAMSQRCLDSIDARGAARVSDVLEIRSGAALEVRPVAAHDEGLLLEWANDSATRRNAFSQDTITAESHHNWLAARLARAGDCQMHLVQTQGGTPVAQVRFDREPDAWRITYAVAPHLRGLGLGTASLSLSLARLRSNAGSVTVVGDVKRENVPSARVFNALGFEVLESGDHLRFLRRL